MWRARRSNIRHCSVEVFAARSKDLAAAGSTHPDSVRAVAERILGATAVDGAVDEFWGGAMSGVVAARDEVLSSLVVLRETAAAVVAPAVASPPPGMWVKRDPWPCVSVKKLAVQMFTNYRRL